MIGQKAMRGRVMGGLLVLVWAVSWAAGQEQSGAPRRVSAQDRWRNRPRLTAYEIKVEKQIYKKTPQGELALYVHYPPGWKTTDKRAAMVFFFGGAWVSGTVEQFRPQADYLAGRGLVTIRADYRVRNRHRTEPEQCVEDAKSAVRWVRQRAGTLGIDPEKIVASGGSAGGHLAACTYTTKGLEGEGEDRKVSSQPNLLVLYNPVLNCMGERIRRRMGDEERARRLSPNLHLSKQTPAAIVLFGTADPLSAQGREMLEKSVKVGNSVVLYEAEGQRHGFFNQSPWLEGSTRMVDGFLVQHGYLKGKATVKVPKGKAALKRIIAGAKEEDGSKSDTRKSSGES